MEIQLTWWTVQQTWRLAYVGIKKANAQGTYYLIVIFRDNICTSFYDIIVDFNACELHLGDEKVFNDFMMNTSVLYLAYDRVECN
jgi:hypothetical protein